MNTKKSSLNPRIALARLRPQYENWKKDNPDVQNEDLINRFLILRSVLGSAFRSVNCALDHDAGSFIRHCSESYAPVRHSGLKQGSPINLSNYLPYLKDFTICEPVSWIVGGVVTHPDEGSENDADFLYMFPDPSEISRIVNFRIHRMLPEDLANRIHALWENRGSRSPFTDCLPLYRLKMERIPDAKIIKMAENRKGPFNLKLRVKHDSKVFEQAEKAWRNDRVTPGEFYHAAKPVRGYYPGQPQTLDLFIQIWNSHYKFPALSSKKYDGEHVEISKLSKDEVVIFSEDGSLLPKLPNLKKAVSNLNADKLVIEAETENWNYDKGQHLPRESVNLNVDEDHFTSNVFDCLYFAGSVPDFLFKELSTFDKSPETWQKEFGYIPKADWLAQLSKGPFHQIDLEIHKYPCLTRFRFLHLLGIPQVTFTAPAEEYRLNLVEHFRDEDDAGLRKRTEFLRKQFGSEGNVVSDAFRPYILTAGIRPYQMLKFHNSTQFHAVVLHPKETKTKGIYNLEYGILAGNRKVNEKDLRILNGQKVVYTGKTFATSDKVPRGGVISVECETFNVVFDMRTACFDVSAWAPRYMGRFEDQPDTIDSAENRAIKDFCFQAKIIGLDGSISYLPGHSGEESPSKPIS